MYVRETTVSLNENPLEWWLSNSWRFPLVSGLARKFLAAPATSVDSERLFSSAGGIITDKRSKLLPERAEQLIFLKVNMPLLNFKYQ